MPANWFGTSLTAALVEGPNSIEREKTMEKDVLTRRYKVREAGITSLIPAFNTTSAGYTSHYLVGYRYKKTGEDDLYDLELKYELTDATTILNPAAPLPPDELEFIAGTTERHLSAHPSYTADWLGNPTTTGTSSGVVDPYGQPSTVATKSAQTYLIATIVYRKVSYTRTKPTTLVSGQNISKRDTPGTETTGTNKWLKTGYTLKITNGVYQISEEWTGLPIGTWDTAIYEAGSNP